MTPPTENRKRKHEDHHPQSMAPSDTASMLSNPPALPPPPEASPPSHSQHTQQDASTTNQPTGTPAQPAIDTTSQQHSQGVSSAIAVATSSVVGAPSSGGKSRPKRSRNKNDKKDENEKQYRFHCDYCAKDLSFTVRARCAVCPDYDSCLDCFSVGAALYPHRPEHAYRLVEVVHTPIYQEGWSADEEEKLLEGLETYGVGNWEQVAKVIGSKEPYETEQHYLNVYLESIAAPLPNANHLLTVAKPPPSDVLQDVDPKTLRVMHEHQKGDAAGWMPKRQDFVYEWDNDAEDLIGDMEAIEDDNSHDKDLKLRVLQIYCKKLDERERRKKFVHERNLTDVEEQQEIESKQSSEERDLRQKLKIFMRFIPKDEFEKFIDGMMSEREVRKRIGMMREARALGATNIEECERLLSSIGKKFNLNNANDGNTINGNSNASNVVTSSGAGGGEPSAHSGTSQRRARRSNGDGSISEATCGGPGGSGGGGNFTSVVSSTKDADSKDRKPVSIFDVETHEMAGAELLSSPEISLCESLKIVPHQYLIVKESLIRNACLKNGHLRKKEAKFIVKLDHTKVSKIYDYLVGCGWIVSTSSASGGGGGSVNNVPNSGGNVCGSSINTTDLACSGSAAGSLPRNTADAESRFTDNVAAPHVFEQ